MSERESWNVVRERRMDSPAARAGYEQTRSAYEIGRTVRELREARSLSHRDLAKRIGTTQSVVGRLEAGGSRPTIVTLDRVAGALGVRLEVRFHDVQGSPKPKLLQPGRSHAPSAGRRDEPALSYTGLDANLTHAVQVCIVPMQIHLAPC